MASIELNLLSDYLEQADLAALERALTDVGSPPLGLDETSDAELLDGNIDDDDLSVILDRLDQHDASCDIYVPSAFEETYNIGGYHIGSAPTLLLVLDELRDEIIVDDGDEEAVAELADEYDHTVGFQEDEAPDAYEMKEVQLGSVWKLLRDGALEAIERRTCLVLR